MSLVRTHTTLLYHAHLRGLAWAAAAASRSNMGAAGDVCGSGGDALGVWRGRLHPTFCVEPKDPPRRVRKKSRSSMVSVRIVIVLASSGWRKYGRSIPRRASIFSLTMRRRLRSLYRFLSNLLTAAAEVTGAAEILPSERRPSLLTVSASSSKGVPARRLSVPGGPLSCSRGPSCAPGPGVSDIDIAFARARVADGTCQPIFSYQKVV